MTNVSAEDIAAMTRLRQIMEGNYTPEPAPKAQVSPVMQATDLTDADPNKAAMKRILATFYRATEGAVEKLREEAPIDREVRRALVTEKTEHGTRIGSWEIRVNESETITSYDVVNVHTAEPLARDLTLYEAAHALVKLLNDGKAINSAPVRRVLDLEETYCRNRADAVSFRNRQRRMERSEKFMEAAAAEDRYEEARHRAVSAKSKLTKLNESL